MVGGRTTEGAGPQDDARARRNRDGDQRSSNGASARRSMGPTTRMRPSAVRPHSVHCRRVPAIVRHAPGACGVVEAPWLRAERQERVDVVVVAAASGLAGGQQRGKRGTPRPQAPVVHAQRRSELPAARLPATRVIRRPEHPVHRIERGIAHARAGVDGDQAARGAAIEHVARMQVPMQQHRRPSVGGQPERELVAALQADNRNGTGHRVATSAVSLHPNARRRT